MEETQERRENVLIVKATLKRREMAEDPLAEITSLVETAGGVVVGSILQKLDRPHPATYLGRNTESRPFFVRNIRRFNKMIFLNREQVLFCSIR